MEAFIVNAFASALGEGNQAGVVLLDRALPDEALRLIALDIGKSETAFVSPAPAGGGADFSLRWFSPVKEMPLCGHATLAASALLFERESGRRTLRFSYSGGVLAARREGEGLIALDFPLDEALPASAEAAYSAFFGLDRFEACFVGARTKKLVLVAPPETDLRAVVPDFAALRAYRGACSNGIALTKASTRYDFESRYFNPWAGVDEDPVTGSVHTLLAAYWGERLGKTELRALQDSQRPGVLDLRLRGGVLELRGRATVVFAGRLRESAFPPGLVPEGGERV